MGIESAHAPADWRRQQAGRTQQRRIQPAGGVLRGTAAGAFARTATRPFAPAQRRGLRSLDRRPDPAAPSQDRSECVGTRIHQDRTRSRLHFRHAGRNLVLKGCTACNGRRADHPRSKSQARPAPSECLGASPATSVTGGAWIGNCGVGPERCNELSQSSATNGRVPDPPMSSIVVIEEDKLMRGLLIEWLSAEGYSVRVAALGNTQAADKVDLVIVDVYMPRYEGAKTLRAVKAVYPETSLIAISGQFRPGLVGPCT